MPYSPKSGPHPVPPQPPRIIGLQYVGCDVYGYFFRVLSSNCLFPPVRGKTFGGVFIRDFQGVTWGWYGIPPDEYWGGFYALAPPEGSVTIIWPAGEPDPSIPRPF